MEIQAHPKFTREQLLQAFEAVQNPTNWKLGNAAWIKVGDFELTNAATVFFAGSPLKIVETVALEGHPSSHLIRFSGYYACIGA